MLERRGTRKLALLRRKSQSEVVKGGGEGGDKGNGKPNGQALSPRTEHEVRVAAEQWEQCPHIPALPLEEVSKMRKEASALVYASVKEAMGPGKEGLHKMSRAVKLSVKKDDIGRTLLEEERETAGMLATLATIHAMLARLTLIRSDRQKKKVQEQEMRVRQGQEERDRLARRLDRDNTQRQNSAEAAAKKRKELEDLRLKLDKSEEDITALQTQVDLLRNQVANAEGRALVSSSQGLVNAAKEAEAKANRLRKEYHAVRERVGVKGKECGELRRAVEAATDDANQADMLAQKDEYRAGEAKKASDKERRKLEELNAKLAVEKRVAGELAEKAAEEEESAQRASELEAAHAHSISGLLVPHPPHPPCSSRRLLHSACRR